MRSGYCVVWPRCILRRCPSPPQTDISGSYIIQVEEILWKPLRHSILSADANCSLESTFQALLTVGVTNVSENGDVSVSVM